MSSNSEMEKLYKSLGLPYHPTILGVAADDKDIKVVRLDEANYSSCRGPNKEEIQASFHQQYIDDDDDDDVVVEVADDDDSINREKLACAALMSSFFEDSSPKKEGSYCGDCDDSSVDIEDVEEEVDEHMEQEIDDEEEVEEEEEVQIEEKMASLSSRKKKSNDAELKRFAMGDNRFSVCNCNPTECKFGGNCVGATTIADMKDMVESFWGSTLDCTAPATSTRRLLILAILDESYNKIENQFYFYAGCKKRDNRRICEAAFLNLLGLMNSPNASKAPAQWINAKKHITSGDYVNKIPYSTSKMKSSKSFGEKRVKFNHAVAFIEYFARTFGDTIPDEHGNCIYTFTTT